MHYAASYVPLVQEEAQVLRWDPNSRRKPTSVTVGSAFALKALLEPGDHLWLMMGSTNVIAALSAFRKGVEVHQLSFPRVQSWLSSNGRQTEEEDTEEEQVGRRTKVHPSQVLRAAQETPHLFYSLSGQQNEVLEIMGAWDEVRVAMRERLSSSNTLRASIHYQANVYGRVRGKQLPADPDEAQEQLSWILYDLLDTRERDEQGKLTGRKRAPSDPHIALLAEDEERKRSDLERICSRSAFYQHLFGDVEGVGSMIGARVIAAVERIERFARPEDLSNYAGMLPRGKEGHMPARKSSKGQMLSRSPKLNTTCFLLQDHMFQWGRNSELGQRLIGQVERNCPCTAEQRQKDKDLRRKHAQAVKQARIAMTRYFLEKIVWPRWRSYMGMR
ncbi:MAG: transposase [Candidatus Yanofskybacteria bacterium]|nr:transposase [Candidatus Yanofskybacteria bacterium]